MKRVEIPFVGASDEPRSGFVSSQLTRNLYVADNGAGGHVLYSTPGLRALFNAGPGPIRGNGCLFNRKGYFVSGDKLIEIDALDTVAVVGTLTGGSSAGYVSMAAGHDYLMIVDGVKGYAYGSASGAATFQTITDADFPVADFVEWIDGYFIVNSHGTGKFFICQNLDDPLAWSALDFAEAQLKADNLIRPIWLNKSLMLLGEYTSELYYNSGNPDFPWTAQPNAIYEYGIIAGASAVSAVGGLYFLARAENGGAIVLRISSQTPQPISPPWLEWQLQQATFTELQQATAFYFKWGGHSFYSLTIPALNRTFLYDETTNAWGEWGGPEGIQHRGAGHLYFNGRHLIGDFETNNIYSLEADQYTDNGVLIERLRRGPALSQSGANMFMRSMTVEFEPGVGLTTGQGSDPMCMMRFSDTGGKTWSNELTASMGKRGEYYNEASFYKLGYFVQRTVEIEVTDPVPVTIRGMSAEIEVAR